MKTNQTTAAIRPVLISPRPNLDHRFCHLFHDHRDLTDTVHIMALRASGILDLLATQFEQEDSNTLCNESIYLAISAVSHEIMDIQAYLKAFSDAQKKPR